MGAEPAAMRRSSGAPRALPVVPSPLAGGTEPALILFQLYRTLLALLLAGLFFGGLGPRFLGLARDSLGSEGPAGSEGNADHLGSEAVPGAGAR